MSSLCIIPARALQDASLSGSDIRVLCAIGIHTDKEGLGCWAKSATLAEEAGVSRAQFFSSVKKLLAGGYVLRVSGQLDGETSSYSVVLDKLPRGVQSARRGESSPVDTPVQTVRREESKGLDAPTINAPLNVPSNAPTTARGSKAARLLKAGAFINRLRAIRAYPSGLQHQRFHSEFTEKEREIASAAGIETILNTPPNSETSLRWQIAEMLEGVA